MTFMSKNCKALAEMTKTVLLIRDAGFPWYETEILSHQFCTIKVVVLKPIVSKLIFALILKVNASQKMSIMTFYVFATK